MSARSRGRKKDIASHAAVVDLRARGDATAGRLSSLSLSRALIPLAPSSSPADSRPPPSLALSSSPADSRPSPSLLLSSLSLSPTLPLSSISRSPAPVPLAFSHAFQEAATFLLEFSHAFQEAATFLQVVSRSAFPLLEGEEATRMRRQGQYSHSRINPMVSAHLQQMSNQRMQQNSAITHFPGRPDTLPTDDHKCLFKSRRTMALG